MLPTRSWNAALEDQQSSSDRAVKRQIRGRRGLMAAMATFTTTSESNLPNLYPARPHYGPKDFARTLRALSTVLKASPGPSRPRSGRTSGRKGAEGLALITKLPRGMMLRGVGWKTQT